MKIRIYCITFSLLLLSGCASMKSSEQAKSKYITDVQPVVQCSSNESKFDCDRRAILAMQGDFEVKFNFEETVELKSGYERKKPKKSDGHEMVLLIEDAGTRISLQHILVTESGGVIKHWRQDWLYESPENWEFVGYQNFKKHTRDMEKVPGTWTQLVYNVHDEPRYTGSGQWNHRYGVSTWTSDRSWRPLPRREYTKRSDYQIINGENRHTVGPHGWTHEQDNTKVIRDKAGKDEVLVREFGFNDYRRIKNFNFKPGYDYWKKTAPFWEVVRQHWAKAFADKGAVKLAYTMTDNAFVSLLFDMADKYKENPSAGIKHDELDQAFKKYVNAVKKAEQRAALD